MAGGELKPIQEAAADERDDTYDEDGESMIYVLSSDDSVDDPTLDILEKSRQKLSKMSFKKSGPRISKENGLKNEDLLESVGIDIPELDEKDGKCFEDVQKLIRDGQLAKLKLDQCKVYLRKHGLRVTGIKDILIARIREHLEIVDGGGEKKYPVTSFVLNCKGDACTGDIVMFEQNVYEMFSIASRSATGPPCGTRIVAGRIVKESYGAAKQQHTFTIEVLWSRGEKPLPPLHPLLIKGRNLYRLKTTRQRWSDEEQRRKVLQEKHARGSQARFSRENRVQEKEMRKMGMLRKKENKNECIPSTVQYQKLPESANGTTSNNLKESIHHEHQITGPRHQPVIKPDRLRLFDNQNGEHNLKESIHHEHQITGPRHQPTIKPDRPRHFDHQNGIHKAQNSVLGAPPPTYFTHRPPLLMSNASHWAPQPQNEYEASGFRGPSSGANFPGSSPMPHSFTQQRVQCRFYRQKRCHYGENCKYLHG